MKTETGTETETETETETRTETWDGGVMRRFFASALEEIKNHPLSPPPCLFFLFF